jgi:UDP-N-acetylmuramoylalanine--D-glutamate ligase
VAEVPAGVSAVVGLGREGLSLVRYLAGRGHRVIAVDRKGPRDLGPALRAVADLPVELVLGRNEADDLLGAGVVYLSPGVPPDAPWVARLREAGRRISSLTELFLTECPAFTVGVTGSCGKSTTTALVGRILEDTGFVTWVGGNIGRPLLDWLPLIRPGDRVVLELSSFQLELGPPSPRIAVVLNLFPDHLDRHPSFEAYAAAKKRIILRQGPSDWAVLNADDPVVASFAAEAPGRVAWFGLGLPAGGPAAGIRGDRLVLKTPTGEEVDLARVDDLRLPGRHNLYNYLAAALAAHLAGATVSSIRRVLPRFRSLPHRLELVGEVGGVRFINDSIATSPVRAAAGVRATPGPVILLAGGKPKGLPLDPLVEAAREKCQLVVPYGQAGPQVHAAMAAGGVPVEQPQPGLAEAFRRAREAARPGDAVLLSPAHASFDEFRDFEHRGEVFRQLVREWLGQNTSR